jgi:hypothetical protein
MAKQSKSILIIAVILFVILFLLIVFLVVMANYYDPVRGLTFIATPTAIPATIGNLPADVKDNQRVVLDGHLAYETSITAMDLGIYGWRDKLHLLRPATWDQIPIWFESTTSDIKEPNQVSGITFDFKHEDIVVYDSRGQEVRPGDLIRVEGRLAPAGSDWHLIVEKVALLKAYPRITIKAGYADLGNLSIVDALWTDDGRLMLIFQASNELSTAIAVEINGQTSSCHYWNQMIYCPVVGFQSGEEILVDLYEVDTHAELEDLLFSEIIKVP